MKVTIPVHATRVGKSTSLEVGPAPEVPRGRVPRVARLMALALKCEAELAAGEIPSRSALAAAARVTTARISQILNLLNLAPDLQEAILFLPAVERGRDPLRLADLQRIASTRSWKSQRKMWRELA